MKYSYGLVTLLIYSGFSYASKPAEKEAEPLNCWANYSFPGDSSLTKRKACSVAQQAAQDAARESENRKQFAAFQLCYIRNKQPVCEMSQKDVPCARAAEMLKQALEKTKQYQS